MHLQAVCSASFRPELTGYASMAKTLYMVVEHFKNKDAVPVYRRFWCYVDGMAPGELPE